MVKCRELIYATRHKQILNWRYQGNALIGFIQIDLCSASCRKTGCSDIYIRP